MLLIKNYAILVLRHLRVVGGNTRVELGLGTGMGDNTRVGLITGRAAWVPFGIAAWVHEVHAEIWASFPRMARGFGTPRGRRVGTRSACRDLGTISTHGAWIWHAAWTPRGKDSQIARHFHAWRVDLARRVDAAWKRLPSAGLTLLTLVGIAELERMHSLNEEERHLVFERQLEIFLRIQKWREENKNLGPEPSILDMWTPEQRQRFLNEWNDDQSVLDSVQTGRGQKRSHDEMHDEPDQDD